MATLKRNIVVDTSSLTGYSEMQILNSANYLKYTEKLLFKQEPQAILFLCCLCSRGAALEVGHVPHNVC